jgi:cell division septal protein FtsQ
VPAPKDRRFRRADVAPQRWRFGRVAWRVIWRAWPAVVILAIVGAAGWWLLTSPWLSVQRLVVGGNTRLSVGEVMALAGDLRGRSILRVNLEAARTAIMASPWIGEVSIARVLPSTIQIHVTERVPMAIARVGTRLYLVDNTGVVIDAYTTSYRDLDLPIVDGLLDPDDAGRARSNEAVQLTGALMDALDTNRALLDVVSQVDVSNPRDAVVLLDGDATSLHLGDVRFVERLRRYLELKPTFQERFEDVESVDFRSDERIYVRRAGGRRAEGGPQ